LACLNAEEQAALQDYLSRMITVLEQQFPTDQTFRHTHSFRRQDSEIGDQL
jgi:hypothetical protein